MKPPCVPRARRARRLWRRGRHGTGKTYGRIGRAATTRAKATGRSPAAPETGINAHPPRTLPCIRVAGGEKSAKTFYAGLFSSAAEGLRTGIPKPLLLKGLRRPSATRVQNRARAR